MPHSHKSTKEKSLKMAQIASLSTWSLDANQQHKATRSSAIAEGPCDVLC